MLEGVTGMTKEYPVVRIYRSILYTWISVRVKRECKEGEDYFLSSGLRQPIRTSVNLPGGLGYRYK